MCEKNQLNKRFTYCLRFLIAVALHPLLSMLHLLAAGYVPDLAVILIVGTMLAQQIHLPHVIVPRHHLSPGNYNLQMTSKFSLCIETGDKLLQKCICDSQVKSYKVIKTSFIKIA